MTVQQVFLSYSLADLDTARHVAGAIEAQGWPLSWERYDDPDAIATLALKEALTASDCVVVLWSTSSVRSDAVVEEAEKARRRGILVQATLDDVSVPMPFVLDDPTPLTDEWSVTTLVQQIDRVLHEETTTRQRESESRAADTSARLDARTLEEAERHAAAGHWDAAIDAYRIWVAQKATDMKATRRLGELYLESGRANAAAPYFERVAEHYQAAGFLVPAIEAYRRLTELVPDNAYFGRRLDALLEEKALQTTATQRSMASVVFTLTAPLYVEAGETFSIDLWAHREEDRPEIAKRLDNEPDESGPLPAGDARVLTARLHVDGLNAVDAEGRLRWDGSVSRAAFRIEAHGDATPGSRAGVIGVDFLGLQIARIRFMVQIGDATAARAVIPSREERHTRAVACFAPEDLDAVEERVRAFEAAAPGVDVSLQALELRTKKDGLSEFLDNISSRDVLYLFWSPHAAASIDVEREWRYALRLRGLDFIDPVPLASREDAPPPAELAVLDDGRWEEVPPPREDIPPPPRPRGPELSAD